MATLVTCLPIPSHTLTLPHFEEEEGRGRVCICQNRAQQATSRADRARGGACTLQYVEARVRKEAGKG